MGLGVSHGCWSGPYTAFTRFRNALADQAGFDLATVTFPDGFVMRDLPLIDWGHHPEKAVYGEWEDYEPKDALEILIAHSDCEGVIYPKEAGRLAIRIKEIVIDMEAKADQALAPLIEQARQFANGLQEAYALNETVVFC